MIFTDFQGLKRNDQGTMMDIYRTKKPANLSGSSPLDKSSAAVGMSVPDTAEQESSRIRKLEKLIKKRL